MNFYKQEKNADNKLTTKYKLPQDELISKECIK